MSTQVFRPDVPAPTVQKLGNLYYCGLGGHATQRCDVVVDNDYATIDGLLALFINPA